MSDPGTGDEFYIGWSKQAPAGTVRFTRGVVATLLALSLSLAAVLAFSQRLIGEAVFEYGNVKKFSGLFQASPYPRLLVPENNGKRLRTHYLVASFKFGLPEETVNAFDGKWVSLSGTHIYREDQDMIELADPSPAGLTEVSPALIEDGETPGPLVSLGTHTLQGEIVDSKCYLGVMNPGRLQPHRACAVRCISGGIPPVLLIRQDDGRAIYLLLVNTKGQAVNKEVLDIVAEPVEISGEVWKHEDMLTLKADPSTYRRLRD